jgi:hypothetical protein
MTTAQVDTPVAMPERLLNDMEWLAQVTNLSVRHLRRLDASRDIPGRVTVGRRVLFQTEVIREWVRAGLPGRDQWASLHRRTAQRNRRGMQ